MTNSQTRSGPMLQQRSLFPMRIGLRCPRGQKPQLWRVLESHVQLRAHFWVPRKQITVRPSNLWVINHIQVGNLRTAILTTSCSRTMPKTRNPQMRSLLINPKSWKLLNLGLGSCAELVSVSSEFWWDKHEFPHPETAVESLLSEEQEKETEVGQLFDPLTSEADPDSHMTVDEEEEMMPRPRAVNKQGDQVLDLTDSEDGDMDNGPFETPLNRFRGAGTKKAMPLQVEEKFLSSEPENEDIVGRENAKRQKNAPYKEHAGKVWHASKSW